MANDEIVIRQLAEVRAAVAGSCEGLPPDQRALPTDCPGWSVRDQVSHLLAIEHSLLGDPGPPPLVPMPPHVRNPIGEINEPWIEQRRGTPGDEVLAEFVETSARR